MFQMINTATGILTIIPFAMSFSLLEDLYTSLLEDYEPNVRPRNNPREPVDVTVSYHLLSVEQLDESNQALVSTGFLNLEWRDDNLLWNVTRYGGIRNLTLPWESIWKPDLMVINSVESFGSLASPGEQNEVNFTSGQIGKEESLFLTSSQWTTEVRAVETIVHNYRNLGETIQQTELKFTFMFQRKYLYCVVTNILPVMFLSVLNLGVFLLPSESGEKVSLSVSIVLSYAVFLTVINESLPESSDNFSIFGVYLLTMLFLKVMTTLSAIVVIKICQDKRKEKSLRPLQEQQVLGPIAELSEYFNRICFMLCLVFTVVITLVCFCMMIL